MCKDDIAFLKAHIKEPPPAPSRTAPDAKILVGGRRAACLRALDKDPEKRFKDANAMIAAIDAAAGHKPLERKGGRGLAWAAFILIVIAVGLVLAARYGAAADWFKR